MTANLETAPALPDVSEEDLGRIMLGILENGKTLREVKGLSHENMEAVYSIAFNSYNGGSFEQADKMFKFLCFFDHLEQKYWMGLGATRQMLKEYAPAVEAYSMAGILNLDDPRPPLQAADCHIALGNLEAARSGLSAAIEASGNKSEYRAVKERAAALLELIDQKAKGASK